MGKGYSKPLGRNLSLPCYRRKREYSCQEEVVLKQGRNNVIPNDVLVDILVRLPARLLLRFKRVCKNWRYLIEDPDFVHRHLALHEEGMGLIRIYDCKARCFRFYSIDDCGSAKELCFLHDNPYLPLSSCNGLLCFADFYLRGVTVCNPVTGRAVTIPKPSCFQQTNAGVKIMAGLGFDPVSKNYKVVCCSGFYGAHEIEVFTLGNKHSSWRSIKCAPKSRICYEKPIYANGNLHWGSNNADDENVYINMQRSITTFSLSEERFGLVIGPDIDQPYYDHGLCEIGGSLGMVAQTFYGGSKKMHLWVLQDYLEQVWVKKCVFELPFKPSLPEGFMSFRNGRVMFESDEDECDYVCQYDEYGELINVTKVAGLPLSSVKSYIDYNVESLLSCI